MASEYEVVGWRVVGYAERGTVAVVAPGDDAPDLGEVLAVYACQSEAEALFVVRLVEAVLGKLEEMG